VEVGKPLRPLAAKLPFAGDEAPTIDTRSARGPTIGPVETIAPPAKRSTQYMKAALVGLFAAVALLVATAFVAKKINPPTTQATAAPSPTQPQTQTQTQTQAPTPTQPPTPTAVATPSQTASAVASASASAEPSASVRPVLTAVTPHVPHPPTTVTARNSWLDRRK